MCFLCWVRTHAYCDGVSECTRMCFLCWVRKHAYCDGVSECTRMCFLCWVRKHAYCEGVPECTRMCFLCWVRKHAYCDGVSECTRMCFLCWVRKHVYSGVNDVYIGLARTIYIRCICGTLGRDSTKYTVYIYGSGQPYVYSDVNARACAFYVVCVSKHVYSDHVNAGACGFLCWVRE